jgi:sugar lactone lactonase YvrE
LAALSFGMLASCCKGPLPPENPKTELDAVDRAAPIEIEVRSTQDPPVAVDVSHTERIVFEDIGLETPESVLYEPVSDTYLVSNIHGSPVEADNNGFISRLVPDGTVQSLRFIAGGVAGVELSAPKGMLILGQTLYVTDIRHVRKFDLESGAPLGSVHFPEATFLNELTADTSGAVYVTDSGLSMGKDGLETNGSDALYKLVGDQISLVRKDTALAGPNGIAAAGDDLWVVTFGANTLTQYSKTGEARSQAQLPTGGLDGVVPLADGTFLISSWQGKAVYHGAPSGPFDTVVADAQSPADIGYDSKRSRILIPLFLANEVWAVPMPAAASANSEGTATSATSEQSPAAQGATPAPPTPATATAPASPAAATP